jgi:hypothetical protein
LQVGQAEERLALKQDGKYRLLSLLGAADLTLDPDALLGGRGHHDDHRRTGFDLVANDRRPTLACDDLRVSPGRKAVLTSLVNDRDSHVLVNLFTYCGLTVATRSAVLTVIGSLSEPARLHSLRRGANPRTAVVR